MKTESYMKTENSHLIFQLMQMKTLNSTKMLPSDVKYVMKSLPVDKTTSGLAELSNRVLPECCHELSSPVSVVKSQLTGNVLTSVLFIKKFHCSVMLKRFSK